MTTREVGIANSKANAYLVPRLLFIISLALLGAYYPKVGRYPTYDWLGFLAVVLTFSTHIIRGRIPNLHRYALSAGVLLIIGAGLTIPHTSEPGQSALSAILIVYVTVIWSSLAAMLLLEWRHLRIAFSALGISVIATTCYAVGQRLLGWPILGLEEAGNEPFWGRATGLTRHPNELGTFTASVFPYLLCLVALTPSRIGRSIWACGAGLACFGVYLSGSMTGAAALVVGGTTYGVFANRRGRVGAIVVPLLIVLGVAWVANASKLESGIAATATERIEQLYGTNEGKFTLNQRLVANVNAVNAIVANPLLGRGYQSQVETLGAHTQVHNAFLRAWYDGGIFTLMGMIVVLLGAGISLLQSRKVLLRLDDTLHRPYLGAAIGGFLALLVSMQASPILYQRSAWFPIALAYAFCVIVRRGASHHAELAACQVTGNGSSALMNKSCRA